MRGALNGDFTPFGYLSNPAHRATSWQATRGGNLRTAVDRPGVEWVYPVGRNPSLRVGLGLETVVDGRPCSTRRDFEDIGLTSDYHSCQVIGLEWQRDGVRVEARFFLASDDALCVRVVASNRATNTRRVQLNVVGWPDSTSVSRHVVRLTEAPCPHVVLGRLSDLSELDLGRGEARTLLVVLARATDVDRAVANARAAAGGAEAVYARLLDEDARFSARCPTLAGDWPAHWREGLVYDFETTRMLVQPPGGIFADVWPSWMAAWPRVVLAEGTLDMLRLAYADPSLAQRAVLSLFRDAPQPNVPCVFRGGEYNMVAADGSRCGTSPAWCLPFLNLELLYLRTLDREWLAKIYPLAAAYLRWWLDYRVDAEGWVVYRCTWESGEDSNPRLDPTASGDADISGRLRPVELQATVAHAAGVLAFFASELGLPQTESSWQQVYADYRQRTSRLFDAPAGRYRDWLIAEQRTQEPCPNRPYWGVDACRYSALSVTPLLIGEPLDEQEVWRHATPPWTLWPSWTYALVESAAAAGLFAQVGGLAFETIDRVYRVTTRREVGSLARPLPAAAPEFWPMDWQTFEGSDAYGWGATTANLLIRHLFGFKESRATDGWVAELTPSFPPRMLELGRSYGIHRMNYRGLVFDLAFRVVAGGLIAELDLGALDRGCWVWDSGASGKLLYASPRPASRHRFPLQAGKLHTLRLR